MAAGSWNTGCRVHCGHPVANGQEKAHRDLAYLARPVACGGGTRGMATIRDKMGHSCPNVCLDRALRETTPPLSEGSGRSRHRSRSFDESPC